MLKPQELVDNNVLYFHQFLQPLHATQFFNDLKNEIKWHDEMTVIGTTDKVKISRKMAYASDNPKAIYNYANFQFPGQYWHPALLDILNPLEDFVGRAFNSCLLNYYEDGKDEIRWHSDKEESLGDKPIIACINLGATSKFWFREKGPDKEPFNFEVSNGDLLIMGEPCQKNLVHAILKEKEVVDARISLTYRFNY